MSWLSSACGKVVNVSLRIAAKVANFLFQIKNARWSKTFNSVLVSSLLTSGTTSSIQNTRPRWLGTFVYAHLLLAYLSWDRLVWGSDLPCQGTEHLICAQPTSPFSPSFCSNSSWAPFPLLSFSSPSSWRGSPTSSVPQTNPSGKVVKQSQNWMDQLPALSFAEVIFFLLLATRTDQDGLAGVLREPWRDRTNQQRGWPASDWSWPWVRQPWWWWTTIPSRTWSAWWSMWGVLKTK